MKTIQWMAATSTLCLSLSAIAQTDTSSKAPPAYGDNPNLIKVLTVKAQEKVQSAAEKVGAVAEKGVAKVKPSVDETWQNTKQYTTEQAVIARDNARQGIDTAVQKVKDTKNTILGTPQGGIPIERGTLSQPSYSSAPQAQPQVMATTPAQVQPTQTIAPEPMTVNTPVTEPATSELNSSTNAQTEFHPSEIQRQSIPIQSSSAAAPVNVESPAPQNNTSNSSNTQQKSTADDEAGLVR